MKKFEMRIKHEQFENDNGTTYTILDKSNSGKYTLLSANNDGAYPYVIAWLCYGNKGSWEQGHYYSSLAQAMNEWLNDYIER